MLSIPAYDSESVGTTTAQLEAAAGVSVSIQRRPRIFKYRLIVIEQTAHNFKVSTSVSALEISDLPPVSIPAAGPIL